MQMKVKYAGHFVDVVYTENWDFFLVTVSDNKSATEVTLPS